MGIAIELGGTIVLKSDCASAPQAQYMPRLELRPLLLAAVVKAVLHAWRVAPVIAPGGVCPKGMVCPDIRDPGPGIGGTAAARDVDPVRERHAVCVVGADQGLAEGHGVRRAISDVLQAVGDGVIEHPRGGRPPAC